MQNKKPEKTEAEVRKEAIALIVDHTKKGVSNKMIVVMLSAMFRQRSLDRVVDPEMLDEMRETLRTLNKLPKVSAQWIDGLLDILEEDSQNESEQAPDEEEKEETDGHEA
jgi:hypothetical protein